MRLNTPKKNHVSWLSYWLRMRVQGGAAEAVKYTFPGGGGGVAIIIRWPPFPLRKLIYAVGERTTVTVDHVLLWVPLDA